MPFHFLQLRSKSLAQVVTIMFTFFNLMKVNRVKKYINKLARALSSRPKALSIDEATKLSVEQFKAKLT